MSNTRPARRRAVRDRAESERLRAAYEEAEGDLAIAWQRYRSQPTEHNVSLLILTWVDQSAAYRAWKGDSIPDR